MSNASIERSRSDRRHYPAITSDRRCYLDELACAFGGHDSHNRHAVPVVVVHVRLHVVGNLDNAALHLIWDHRALLYETRSRRATSNDDVVTRHGHDVAVLAWSMVHVLCKPSSVVALAEDVTAPFPVKYLLADIHARRPVKRDQQAPLAEVG